MSQGENHEASEKIESLTPLIGFQLTEMSQEGNGRVNLQESKKLGEASQKTEIFSPFIE